jgi:hypothetical protein
MVLAPTDKVRQRGVDWGSAGNDRMTKPYSVWAKAWVESGNQWKDKEKR